LKKTFCLLLLVVAAVNALPQTRRKIPRIWDDGALQAWATPIAALNTGPAHYSTAEYYASPVENLRTYPVYPPDREPAGYWEWLQKQKPEPLVDADAIRSNADWIEAGERAFREIDVVLARTADPSLIARARDPRTFDGVLTLADGSVPDPRWVMTNQGLMLTLSDCSNCHTSIRPDRSVITAGPALPWTDSAVSQRPHGLGPGEFLTLQFSRAFPNDSLGVAFWRMVSAPWTPDERVEKLRDITNLAQMGAYFPNGKGGTLRANGSPFHNARVPDLHNLSSYKYLDATGTHRLRNPEDVARYIAQVTGTDKMTFGRVSFHFADEVLYAIAKYLLSLEPLKNPEPAPREIVAAGKRVFDRSGCKNSHVPPRYTNGKLTPADGFTVPRDHPNRKDIMAAGVGTDAGLALKTRKGTGLYKVPSLRGVWLRPFLLHDGSVASLEELFDSNRLEPSHVPGGWKPPSTPAMAIPGHRFGLHLTAEEKASLLAFLRQL
jgi:hypothetical protein